MTAEPYCPQPEPEPRTGSFPGDYCPTCGRPAPCQWHPRVRVSDEQRMVQELAAYGQHEMQRELKW